MIRFWTIFFGLLIISACSGRKSDSQNPSDRELTGQIELEDQWARPGSAGGNSAGYLTIFNGTRQDQVIDGLQTDQANTTELHESFEENGQSGMRPTPNMTIRSGDSLVLEPGSFHIMFMDIENNWDTGDSIQVILTFSETGSVQTTLPIKNFPDD